MGNSGHSNSGNRNSGHCNSGNRNSGDYNSGNRNSGDYNSGDNNSGSCNSGDCNSGDYNSGHFNTDAPTARMFNQDTGLSLDEINIPHIDLPITEWVPEKNMSAAQEKDDPKFHVKGGTLIKRSYKDAWAIAWSRASKEIKQGFLDLPNFDPAIFLEITGIDVRNEGKVKVEANGKTVWISKELAKELGL